MGVPATTISRPFVRPATPPTRASSPRIEVLAGITLLAPRFPRLKEWAYAGIFFNMTGAAASRAARGDDVSHIVAPLVFAGLAVTSWALRPQSRTLGVLSPAEKRA